MTFMTIRKDTNQLHNDPIYRRKVAWIWASLEAKRQLNFFDGYLCNKARLANISEEDLRDFARYYSVARSVTFSDPESGYKSLSRKLKDSHFITAPPQRKYNQLLSLFKKICSRGSGTTFSAKLTWFYHPDEWPMSDTLAKDALAMYYPRGKKTYAKQNYPEAIKSVFTTKELEIVRNLISSTKTEYPYALRIVDKYLFLVGSGNLDNNSVAWIDWMNWMIDQSPATINDSDIEAIIDELGYMPKY
ncbi:hypothetical protein [Paremcibacter congregatus]|uniref:hypothetical protein n=1 Tax=Paremcibacter congregatus TaxID=2043170 RepID=UPI003A9357B2